MDKKKIVRMSKKKPSLKGGEIACFVEIDAPQHLFEKPAPVAKIELSQSNILGSVEVTVADLTGG